MGLGRRKVRLDDESAWVFNRMAEAYGARPPYPEALIGQLSALANATGPRVADLGAGIGHLTVPLAARGLSVTAIEPARAMLMRLERACAERDLKVRTVHATAEALPLEDASFDLVVIADALHFLDVALTGKQVARLLARPGALAVVTCEFADTPFMRAITRVMEESAPRRPRSVQPALKQLAALSGVALDCVQQVRDDTPVDADTLSAILRSISYIGPAMSPTRYEAFRARVEALSSAPVWSRRFTLHSGRRA